MKFLRIVLFLSIATIPSSVLCNHVLGGSISYQCLGGNQYGITLQLYKDCFGATPAASEETVFFFPSGCGSIPFSVDLDFLSEVEISDLCASELANSSCSGGFIPGTQLITYYEVVVLNPACIWEIEWSSGDWNYFVNIDFSSLPNAFFNTTIDPSVPCSPPISISSLGVPYYCTNVPVNWQITVNNPSGYTLDFSLTPILTTGGVSAPYEAGYTGASPIPGIAITPSGLITFTAPMQFGSYAVGVQIDMYDALGNYVGTFYENMAFVIRLCLITTTDFTAPGVVNADPNVNLLSGTEISVCAGESFCFDVEATNLNSIREITLTSDFTTLFPTGTFNQWGDNPAVGVFCLTTDETMIGTYLIEIEANDDACILPGYDQLFITINIEPNITVSITDALICLDDVLSVNATGALTYNWNIISGDADPEFSCLDCGNQSLSPDQNTVIEIIGVGAPLACNYRDTLSILVSLSDFTAAVIPESCAQNDGSIDITINSGSGTYTYLWSIAPIGNQDQVGLDEGTYTVVITDVNIPGCQVDSIFIIDTTPAPTGSISGDITICEGATADIVFDLSGIGPFMVDLNPGGIMVMNDGDVLTVSPISSTTYTLLSIQDSNIPPCTYTISSSAIIDVRPLVESNFLPVNEICEGDQVTLEFNISEVGTYNVSHTPGGPSNGIADGAGINVSPIINTTYTITSVSYVDLPFCFNVQNNSIDVVVNDLPSAVLSGGDEICEGEPIDLSIDLTGTGPWVVSYTINGISQTDFNIVSSPFVFSVSPLVTSEYCLTLVEDQGVNCSQILNSCETVIVEPVPQATIASDMTICTGASADLIIDLLTIADNFNATIQITDSQGSGSVQLTNLVSPYTYTTFPSETTTYELISVEYSNNSGDCVTQINETVTVQVNSSIEVIIVDTVCTPNAVNYQVLFEVLGGDPGSYSSTPIGAAAGAFGVDSYTSGFIVSGSGASWQFTDLYDCNPVNIAIDPYNCPIVTYSGTMLTDTVVVCGNDIATTTWNNDGIFDFDDQLMFILHDNPGNSIGSIFATDCNDSNFNDPDSPLVFGTVPGLGVIVYGTVYYVSAVVGDDDGSGDCVNINAPFISVSEGQPVVFYDIPTASISGGGAECIGNSVDVQIDFAGTSPWDIVTAIDGIDQASVEVTTSPYIFSTDLPGDYTLSSVFSNVCGGATIGLANVVINPLPTAILDGDASICFGDNHDFEITLTGTAPWNFDIEQNNSGVIGIDNISGVLSSPHQYTGSLPGTYTVTNLSDGNGCDASISSDEVTLTVYDIPTADFAFADTSYCEGSSLDLIIDLSGQEPWIVTYTIDGGVNQTWNIATSPYLESISNPGTYLIVLVEDANGCIDNISANDITVAEISSPIMNAGPDGAACSGENLIIGTAAIVGQTYQWDPSTGLDDPSLAQPTVSILNSSPDPESYTFVLTVFNQQCSLTDDVEIVVQPVPAIDAGETDTLCFGSSLQLNATGGLIYLWADNGFFFGNINVADPIVLPDQSMWFFVTGYDDFSCEGNDSVFVFVAEELVVTEDFNPNVCFGTCSGSISLSAEGGIPDYSVEWTNSANTGFTIENLCVGNYDYIISDSFGCDTTGSIVFTELLESFIDDVNVVPSSCFGASTGLIEVFDAFGISYSLTNIPSPITNATGVFDDLSAGEYVVEMTDADGCFADTIVSFVASSLEITMSTGFSSLLVCYNQETTFEGTAVGGDGSGFTYNWYNCQEALPGCTVAIGNPIDFVITQDTTFYVVAIDGLGCSSDTIAMSTFFNPAIQVTAGPADIVYLCEGECVDLTAGAGGGGGPIDITWEADNGSGPEIISTNYNTTDCPLINTWYVATGDDGCTPMAYDSVYVLVYEMPEAILEVSVQSGCYPTAVTFYNLTDPDMLGNCLWDIGNGNTLAVCSDFEYTYASAGNFIPTLTVTSPDGCVDIDSLDSPISINNYPVAAFTWEPQPVTTLEHEVQFIDLSEDAQIYDWNFAGLGISSFSDPLFNFPSADFQEFPVCLKVINEFGCEDSVCVSILMESVLLIYVPNAFTPDGDGTNDVFEAHVAGIDPSAYRLVIFDRWGNRVFESTTVGEVWTGNIDNGDYFGQNDTYVWRIEVKDLLTGDAKLFKGHVSLLR